MNFWAWGTWYVPRSQIVYKGYDSYCRICDARLNRGIGGKGEPSYHKSEEEYQACLMLQKITQGART